MPWGDALYKSYQNPPGGGSVINGATPSSVLSLFIYINVSDHVSKIELKQAILKSRFLKGLNLLVLSMGIF